MKDISGYEGFFKVTMTGLVYSVPRKDRLNRDAGGIFLKQGVCGAGYKTVSLNKEGKKKTCMVHTLVATAYIPKPIGKTIEVNHKDGNKFNNNVDNLEWMEHSENIKHQYSHLGRKMSNAHKEKLITANKNAIRSVEYRINKSIAQSKSFGNEDKILELARDGHSQKRIGALLDMSQAAISRFINGKLKHLILTRGSE